MITEAEVESARREWEEGHRRLHEQAREEPQPERLLGQVDTVIAELRRRVGGTFTIAEALTNAARHAEANRVYVEATVDNGWLHVEVRDDGRGGADPDSGTGLRGLADRLAAIEGRLKVSSSAGAGTIVRAEIPCAS